MLKPFRSPGFSENEIHRWLETFPAGRRVELGIGHDAAVVRCGPRIFLKTDQVVEGVHFSLQASARLAGRKALFRSLSDAAAVGGEPEFALASLAVPARWSRMRLRGFLEGIRQGGKRYGVSLVGGDLSRTQGPFVASLTLVGSLPGKRSPGKRSLARPDQAIFVTGSLGGSILGKHLRFDPRVEEGERLHSRYRLGAIMDLSDGLAADLPRLCRASRVGATIEEKSLPVSKAARSLSARSGRSPLWHAWNDGEDYELLFTADRSEAKKILRDPLLRRCGVSLVGEIRKGRGVWIVSESGKLSRLAKGGYEHVWR